MLTGNWNPGFFVCRMISKLKDDELLSLAAEGEASRLSVKSLKVHLGLKMDDMVQSSAVGSGSSIE